LSDGVLAKICKKAGLPMQPNLTRDKRVSAAKLCYLSSGNGNTDGIDDLKDEELIDICERIKFPIPQNPTREQLVISARMCRKLASKDGTKSVISLLGSMYGENIGECGIEDNKAEYVACLERDAKRLHIEYLTYMNDDASFVSKNRNDRISYLLSKYNIDDVPAEEKVMRQLLLKLIEEDDTIIKSISGGQGRNSPVSQCERPEDLDSPSCKVEDVLMSTDQYKLTDLSDKQLIKVCDRIGSDSGSGLNNLLKKAGMPLGVDPDLLLAKAGISLSLDQLKSFRSTREEIVKSATSCYNTIKASKETAKRLHLDYRDMMKDASFISKFRYRYDRINYLLRKHGITDEKMKVVRHLLLEILDEEDSYILEKLEESSPGRNTTLLDYQSKQVGVGYRPTPEEVAKLPFIGKRMLKRHIGLYDGQVKLYRQYGSHLDDKEITPIIAVWSARENKWDPFEIYHLYKHAADGYDINDCVRKAGKYEHIFPLGPPTGPIGSILPLGGSSKKILVGYNNGDDPQVIARDAIDEYKLDESEYESIATILERQVNLVAHEEINDQQRKPGYQMNQSKSEAYHIILFFASAMIGFICVLSNEYASQRKRSPKKSPQSLMKKTVYVKLFASKNLNGKQGRRLNGIITKSGVDDIEIEKKTGQPTVMYKIEASNGVVYVPVHIKGSAEAVQKAVVLIQQAIGKENIDEKIELPPTKPKQAATSTSKISSSAPLKIPKKKKSTDRSLLPSIRSTARRSCQSLGTTAVNTYKRTTNYIGKGTVIAVAVLYSVLVMISLPENYQRCSEDNICSSKVVFVWLVLVFLICSAVVLVLRIIAYGLSLMLKHDARITKSLVIIFGMLSCILLFDWINGGCIDRHEKCELWASQGLCYEEFESMQKNCRSSCNPDLCQPGLNIGSLNRWTFNILSLLSLSCVVLLLLQVMAYCISMLAFWLGLFVSAPSLKEQLHSKLIPVLVFDFISGVLRMPFNVYQAKKIEQTIYIKPSRSKNLSGKQGRKKKEIIKKSGVDDIQIDTTAVGDNYMAIHVTGSRRNVWKAIELIQEAVGADHVCTTKPSNTMTPVQESAPSTVNTSEPQPIQEESTTQGSPVQRETMSDNCNSLAKEASTTTKSPPATTVHEKEEIPSEIGIDSSQGMITRDTITEASMTSLNDRSNISKAYSSFTLNEDDPLLIFLRSQASCIKGSVDEFYTWLVKSEDIDSMIALKEAVNEDDYLNDMKVGDGGGSGIKGFKRKAFLRAISEYFDDESDTKSTEVHQSLPQCQKKNPSVEPPEELVCPISLVLMTNEPVLAADGIMYERASIEDWFTKSKAKIRSAQENLKQNPQSEPDKRVINNGVCSPILGTKMENLTLMPHIGTRNMARSFEEKQNKISP